MSVTYTPAVTMQRQIELGFTMHQSSPEQLERIQAIYKLSRSLARAFASACPPSRELSLAITHLEEAAGWAVSAIVRNEAPEAAPESE